MAIDERIWFFRNLRGMTQKYLGMQVGFSEQTPSIHIAQYESGSRTPKPELTKKSCKSIRCIDKGFNYTQYWQLQRPNAHAVYSWEFICFPYW